MMLKLIYYVKNKYVNIYLFHNSRQSILLCIYIPMAVSMFPVGSQFSQRIHRNFHQSIRGSICIRRLVCSTLD